MQDSVDANTHLSITFLYTLTLCVWKKYEEVNQRFTELFRWCDDPVSFLGSGHWNAYAFTLLIAGPVEPLPIDCRNMQAHGLYAENHQTSSNHTPFITWTNPMKTSQKDLVGQPSDCSNRIPGRSRTRFPSAGAPDLRLARFPWPQLPAAPADGGQTLYLFPMENSVNSGIPWELHSGGHVLNGCGCPLMILIIITNGPSAE